MWTTIVDAAATLVSVPRRAKRVSIFSGNAFAAVTYRVSFMAGAIAAPLTLGQMFVNPATQPQPFAVGAAQWLALQHAVVGQTQNAIIIWEIG